MGKIGVSPWAQVHTVDAPSGFLMYAIDTFFVCLFWLCWVFCMGLTLQLIGLVTPGAWGILVTRLGIEPMSLALEGRFLSTGPPGKFLK